MSINPLANPKGVKLTCELCGKVAHLQCQFCNVTYYWLGVKRAGLIFSSSKEHQLTDWTGIHVKICQLLVPLRTPSKVLGSEEERNRREKMTKKTKVQPHRNWLNLKHTLLELSRLEAQKHLHEGQFELSIPAALQSLRFSIELYGPGTVDLVPSYLLLGEGSIGSQSR